ncbi:MAG: glucose PTS transporter subunit EIIB [Azospirillaceae bacterium]|nr:glucose PTS transporter subunit EIIB [Azospirillaceae bacterium]
MVKSTFGWLQRIGKALMPSAASSIRDDHFATAQRLVLAFGGRTNINSLDACITRLRVGVNDITQVRKDQFEAMGAAGTVVVGNNIQVIFGTASESLKTTMDGYLRSSAPDGVPEAAMPPTSPVPARGNPAPAAIPGPVDVLAAVPDISGAVEALRRALGGDENILKLEAVAGSRLQVTLEHPSGFDEKAAKQAGMRAAVALGDGVFQLIMGPAAGRYAAALRAPQRGTTP